MTYGQDSIFGVRVHVWDTTYEQEFINTYRFIQNTGTPWEWNNANAAAFLARFDGTGRVAFPQLYANLLVTSQFVVQVTLQPLWPSLEWAAFRTFAPTDWPGTILEFVADHDPRSCVLLNMRSDAPGRGARNSVFLPGVSNGTRYGVGYFGVLYDAPLNALKTFLQTQAVFTSDQGTFKRFISCVSPQRPTAGDRMTMRTTHWDIRPEVSFLHSRFNANKL